MSKKATGVCNLYYAPFTYEGDQAVYETPRRIHDAEEITAEEQIAEASNYADNLQNIYVSKITGANITIAVSHLDPEIDAILGGAEYEDGQMETCSDNVAKGVAILYQRNYNDGSYDNIVYYNCTLRKQSNSAKTEGESIEFTGDTLTGKAIPLSNKKIKYMISSDKVGNSLEAKKKLANFFKEVQFIDVASSLAESENTATQG